MTQSPTPAGFVAGACRPVACNSAAAWSADGDGRAFVSRHRTFVRCLRSTGPALARCLKAGRSRRVPKATPPLLPPCVLPRQRPETVNVCVSGQSRRRMRRKGLEARTRRRPGGGPTRMYRPASCSFRKSMIDRHAIHLPRQHQPFGCGRVRRRPTDSGLFALSAQ